MKENHELENKPINKEDNETPLDNERRAIMKKSACLIGAAYIAPATLSLLLSAKPAAASIITGPPGHPEP